MGVILFIYVRDKKNNSFDIEYCDKIEAKRLCYGS